MISKPISSFDTNYCYPLYCYPDNAQQHIEGDVASRQPNLNDVVVQDIAMRLGMRFTLEKRGTRNAFTPLDLLDYIYAILYSSAYRKKYNDYLKIDFPRVPYPAKKQFSKLVKCGARLRTLHTMEDEKLSKMITTFPQRGSNVIERVQREADKVMINAKQFFGKVPDEAWNAYIGGYQPAQKWLEERIGENLSSDDIEHYQKIIVALVETGKIMKSIDKILALDT